MRFLWFRFKPRDPFRDAPPWARALREHLLTLESNLRLFVVAENTKLKKELEDQLEQATSRLETTMNDLGIAIRKEVADAKAEIQQALDQAVVSPGVAKAILARLNVLGDNVTTLTATTVASGKEISETVPDEVPATTIPVSTDGPVSTSTPIPVPVPEPVPTEGGTTAPANDGSAESDEALRQ